MSLTLQIDRSELAVRRRFVALHEGRAAVTMPSAAAIVGYRGPICKLGDIFGALHDRLIESA